MKLSRYAASQIFFVGSLLIACNCIELPRVSADAPHTSSRVFALTGTKHPKTRASNLASGNAVAAVIFFAKHDCPIANSCLPTMDRLHKEFQNQSVRFLMVYPSPVMKEHLVSKHVAEYSVAMPTYLDSDLSIAETLAATTTPEVFVLSPDGSVLYRGRVNDKYVGYGKRRRQATREDLREALLDVVSERPVRVPETKSVGCLIPRHVHD